jgi:hypothetical protein
LRDVIEEVASLVVLLRLWCVVKIMEELSVGPQDEMECLYEQWADLEKQTAELNEGLQETKARASHHSS